MSKTIKILPVQTIFKLPAYNHIGDAGLDLFSMEEIVICPMERKKVGCGFAIEIPEGYLGAIAPRSGLAYKYGLTVLNAWGVIDSSYRGEVSVILINLGSKQIKLEKYSRIAQLIILPYEVVHLSTTEALSVTERKENGFGSSGD
jgi:dUTP pyrophosphatase